MASGRLVDYLGSGVIADRPASLTLAPDSLGLWWATDTTTLSTWDGTSWVNVAGGGGGGTVASVVPGAGIDVDATDPANPIVDLDAATIASLLLADSATQPGDLATIAFTGDVGDLTGFPGGSALFLREDGTFASPSGGGSGTVTSVDLTSTTGLTASGGPITTAGSLTYTLSANLQAWHGLATSAKQDADADLTAIAALAPTDDDIIQRKAGAWTNRTMAQLVTDLNLSATYLPLAGGTMVGDIQFNDTDFRINATTSDAADSSRISLSGGGSAAPTRGAFIILNGNEHASTPADMVLGCGIGGNFQINAGGVGGSVEPTSNNLYDLGSTSFVWKDVYATNFYVGSSFLEVGTKIIPQNSKSAAYTLVLADSGGHIFHPSADTTARIWTIPANASVAYPIGTALTFINQNGAGVITIAITSDTMRLAGAGTTGSRTLAANGVATAIKVTATEWIISGTGLT